MNRPHDWHPTTIGIAPGIVSGPYVCRLCGERAYYPSGYRESCPGRRVVAVRRRP